VVIGKITEDRVLDFFHLVMSASAVQASTRAALGALPSKFSKARTSGALYFFDSDVKNVEEEGRRVSSVGNVQDREAC